MGATSNGQLRNKASADLKLALNFTQISAGKTFTAKWPARQSCSMRAQMLGRPPAREKREPLAKAASGPGRRRSGRGRCRVAQVPAVATRSRLPGQGWARSTAQNPDRASKE